MNDAFAENITWSTNAFLNLVWPNISCACGGGELIPVEAVTSNDMRQKLDVLAGIDAWQICYKEDAMRGIASRVQRGWKAWNTFTIRYQRSTGNKTEFQKRLDAIKNPERGWLFPHLTCHAYVSQDLISLLSCAIIRTNDLILYARAALNKGDTERAYIKPNSADGNEFVVIPWFKLKEDNIRLVIHSEVD